MKHLLLLIICSLTTSFVAAQSMRYGGDLDIDGYTRKNVIVEIQESDGDAVCFIYKVKFSRFMPVTVDMELGGLHKSDAGAKKTLSGTKLIPKVKGKPYTKRIVKTFRATINGNQLDLDMSIGEKHCTYHGERLQLRQ